MTAIAVLQLWEQGLVDLDTPASEHLRAYRLVPARASFRPATLHRLLTHTAGVRAARTATDLLRLRYPRSPMARNVWYASRS